jgi:putative flippase GtrA
VLGRILSAAARFGVVSVINTLVDVAVFSSLTMAAHVPPAAANVLSYASGVACGFVLNRFWVFRRLGGDATVQLAKFMAVNLVSLAISTAAVGLMAMVMPAILAKLLSLPITFVWNFGLSHFWVFRRRPIPARTNGLSFRCHAFFSTPEPVLLIGCFFNPDGPLIISSTETSFVAVPDNPSMDQEPHAVQTSSSDEPH